MLSLLGVTLVLAVALRLAIPYLAGTVAGGVIEQDGSQTLKACPGTPNCQIERLSVQGDVNQSIAIMAGIISDMPGTTLVSQKEGYLHATFKTPVMGFIDDVEILLPRDSTQAAEASPYLLVRSASRLGHSDLGANAARIEQLSRISQGRL